MNKSQLGESVDYQKKRYFFAKPVLSRRRSIFSVKPVLVTQMQYFGDQGRPQEIFDVLSIGYLSSWCVRDIREFVLLRNCYPDFVISGDNLCDTSQPSKRLIGAAVRNVETTGASGNLTATLWVGDLSCWVRHGAAGTYDVFINLQLALQWIPKRTQVVGCFHLAEIWKRRVNTDRQSALLSSKKRTPIGLLLVSTETPLKLTRRSALPLNKHCL